MGSLLSTTARAAFGLILLAGAGARAADLAAPPPAPEHPFSETLYGQTLSDPYRWMEQRGPEFDGWLKAQADYARKYLDALPNRGKVLDTVLHYDGATTRLSGVVQRGDLRFFTKRGPGDNNFKLWVRNLDGSSERVLIDPEKRGTAKHHVSIDFFQPSNDGRYLAYGLSPAGSENSVIHVLDVASGKDLPDVIDRGEGNGNDSGPAGISWRSDDKSFFYNRLKKLAKGDPATEKFKKSKVFLHKLGRNPDKDPAVFGYGVTAGANFDETDLFAVYAIPESDWSIGLVQHGTRRENTIFVTKTAEIAGDRTVWRKIVDVDDGVINADIHGSDVYLLSHKDASRFKVLKFDLNNGDIGKAVTVVPEGKSVIVNFGVAKDALYVVDMDGGPSKLRRLAYTPQAVATPIDLPFDGSIDDVYTDARLPGIQFGFEGWVHPLQYLSYSASTGFEDTHLTVAPGLDIADFVSEESTFTARDGTVVPISIIRNKHLQPGAPHPTMVWAYGAYAISQTPVFSGRVLSWLALGGVWVDAHVRGGGEYGEDWHMAGFQATKPNTWHDLIDAGDTLIKQGWTDAKHLAIQGGSAGGITVGRALTDRPELFAAVLCDVGAVNTLRFEFSANGPPNIPEFGTIKNEAGFKALYEMDATAHVKPGERYPAVLITTGTNDPRVDSWEPAKFAAHLQKASSSGKPILMRVDYDAGHGIGSTKRQRDEEIADQFAFVLSQFGDPAKTE